MSHDAYFDKCLRGEALADDIDDYIDQWHEGGSGIPLWKFLGFTKAEYKLWVEKPNSLDFIFYARKSGTSLEIVQSREAVHNIAARSLSPEDAEDLTKWLKKIRQISD